MKPSFIFFIRPLIFFLLILFLNACEKEYAEIKVKNLNFSGCDKSKSLSSNGCTKFEQDGSEYLKISRYGILLNCAVDSISISFDTKSGQVNIVEQEHAKSAAFCNCPMTYTYSIGPLERKNQLIRIQGCKGELIEFNYTTQAMSVEICR